MNFSNIKNKIKEAIIVSGYARTAKELNLLSNRQLEDIGFSRELLKLGASGYPWREEVVSQEIPDNVTNLNTMKSVVDAPLISKTPKAA